MADSNWAEWLIGLITAGSTGAIVASKVKGRRELKMQVMEESITNIEKTVDEFSKSVNHEITKIVKTVDDKFEHHVHVNDCKSSQEIMSRDIKLTVQPLEQHMEAMKAAVDKLVIRSEQRRRDD